MGKECENAKGGRKGCENGVKGEGGFIFCMCCQNGAQKYATLPNGLTVAKPNKRLKGAKEERAESDIRWRDGGCVCVVVYAYSICSINAIVLLSCFQLK